MPAFADFLEDSQQAPVLLSVVGDDHNRQPALVRGRQETLQNGWVGDMGKNDEWTLHGSFLGAAVARPGGSGN